MFAPRVGGVFSADIAVPEHQRVARFYASVLSTGETPLWRDDLVNNLGLPVIGLGPHSAEYAQLPLQWIPHIQVADVAISVERALDLGGKDLMLDTKNQWAVLLDPNGTAFGLIPVVSSDASPALEGTVSRAAVARAGSIAWLDLTVAHASSTRDFYRRVIGWSVQEVEMADASERYADYNMIDSDGKPAAGICHARGMNLGLPPVWMIYLPVGDLAESLRRVQEGGGRIIKEITGGDGGYAYVIIEDPVGATLALV